MPNIVTSAEPLNPVGAKIYGVDSAGVAGVFRTSELQDTVDIIGNSIAATSIISVDPTTTYQYGTSIISNLCAALGQRIRTGSAFATGGITSSNVITTHLQSFLDSSSKYGIFVAFENDILAITLAQSIANVETIMLKCKKYGKKCVFVGPLPSFSYTTTASRDNYYGLCNYIMGACERYGFHYLNAFPLYGDYSSAYPQPLAGYTDTSVHPNSSTVINKIVKRGLLPIFDAICPPSRKFFAGGNSVYNGVTNPNFAGTAGTAGTNASGVFPDSWIGHAYGAGNSGVFSKEASTDVDDTAPWFQGAYSGSTAGSLVMASSTFSLSGSQFAVGDTIIPSLEMEVTSGGTGCANMDLWVMFTGSSKYIYSNVDSVGVLAENPGRLVISGPKTVIPAGTTGMAVYGRFRAAGTFNFAGRVRHPSIIKVTS